MEILVKVLLVEGWAVQLKHVPEETSWEDTVTHGFVKVKDAAGKVLCDVPGFQHHKKLGRALERALAVQAACRRHLADGAGQGRVQRRPARLRAGPRVTWIVSEKAASKEAA